MKGDKKVVQYLNVQFENELAVISQCFLHTCIYGHRGLKRIGDHEYKESIGEMGHADHLIERTLMLDGLPSLQNLGKVFIGQDTRGTIKCDLKLERTVHGIVVKSIIHCESVKDYVSREILINILDNTEEHIDRLKAQLELIDKVGIQNYLQPQMEPEGE